jgi:hypothetical protein
MSGLRVFVLGVTLSLVATPAFAGHFHFSPPPRHGGRGVPEIDPAGLGSAVTLLAGGALLAGARLRSRRKVEKKI